MLRKKLHLVLVSAGLLTLIGVGIAFVSVQPARAQCGSQASSCKNCHETQGQKPVNNDGTGWHESHAFGDFCYICHGGNNQATGKDAAHAGMVAPLADVQAACGQCHPNDLQARAEVYAVKLGMPVGTTANPPSEASPTAVSATASLAATAQSAPLPPSGQAPNDPNLTDYVQRYNANVLNKQPTNWGNVILWIILAALVLAGGFFVIRREGWISVSLTEKKPLNKEYPADVVEIASRAAQLKPAARKSLEHLLGKPRATAELLVALERLTADDTPEEKS